MYAVSAMSVNKNAPGGFAQREQAATVVQSNEVENKLHARIPSTSARSAPVSFHEAARLLARTCSGVLAPAITLETSRRAASQENASSSNE